MSTEDKTYLHGFSEEEHTRLYKQAKTLEHTIYSSVDFSRNSNLIEIGCGVGAQTEILLRRFPNINITSIDLSTTQLKAACKYIGSFPDLAKRWTQQKVDASKIDFKTASFDSAFICWVLEHVPSVDRVISEAYRILEPGAKIVINEVMNSTFFLDPYSPKVWKYWMAFNDLQFHQNGDPFVGAKLGSLLEAQGFKDIQTIVKVLHYDRRSPKQRETLLRNWLELLLSAGPNLIENKLTTKEEVAEMEEEFRSVMSNQNAIIYYSFMQAHATR